MGLLSLIERKYGIEKGEIKYATFKLGLMHFLGLQYEDNLIDKHHLKLFLLKVYVNYFHSQNYVVF